MKNVFTILSLFLFFISTLFGQGDTLSRTMFHDDILRNYILYIPAAYDGTEEWPLVINMHGYAGNAQGQMINSNMNVVADTGRFLIVYPQGTPFVSKVPNTPPQGLGWNISISSDTTFYPVEPVDDLGFINRLIDEIGSGYQVNPERVYATGFSNGGMMSNVLACELSNRIAAIAPVGATAYKERPCTPSRQVPVLQIHGTLDPVINYETGDGAGLVKGAPDYLTFWRDFNGCDMEPMVTTFPDLVAGDGSTVELQVWENCDKELRHYKVIGGGHQWPGGIDIFPPFLGNFNRDISASSEIWNFFNRHQHPGPGSAEEQVFSSDLENFRIYPNPFYEELTVEFDLPRSLPVQWTLFNSLGQPVSRAMKSDLPPGFHRLQWKINNTGIPSGIYYLTLKVGKRQIVRPVLYYQK